MDLSHSSSLLNLSLTSRGFPCGLLVHPNIWHNSVIFNRIFFRAASYVQFKSFKKKASCCLFHLFLHFLRPSLPVCTCSRRGKEGACYRELCPRNIKPFVAFFSRQKEVTFLCIFSSPWPRPDILQGSFVTRQPPAAATTSLSLETVSDPFSRDGFPPPPAPLLWTWRAVGSYQQPWLLPWPLLSQLLHGSGSRSQGTSSHSGWESLRSLSAQGPLDSISGSQIHISVTDFLS